MNVIFSSKAKDEFDYWQKYNSKIFKRVQLLIEDIKRHQYTGLGKPEPLRFKYSGYWSRRINQEHRLVYRLYDDNIFIAQCRYHYGD